MADNHFFDLLKNKMAEMQPSDTHREADWASLGERLNAALPQQPRQRRTIVLPLLLLTAMLLSNAAWWQSSLGDRTGIATLEAQVASLQISVAAIPPALLPPTIHDTLWRTIYIQTPAIKMAQPTPVGQTEMAISGASQVNDPVRNDVLVNEKITETGHAANSILHAEQYKAVLDSTLVDAGSTPLENNDPALLKRPNLVLSTPDSVNTTLPESKKPAKTFAAKFSDALRPKFFTVGASAGWLYANSASLMHQGGLSCDLHGQIGLSRHWSVTAGFGTGRVHYKSHEPGAILGAPELPMLPSTEHHFAEMDITGQKIQQFQLGLRYTFGQLGKSRPFLGLGWGGQTLLPFTIEYEIRHEPTGTIHKGAYEVTGRTHLRNMLGLNAGIEIPISPRLDLNLEGFYTSQWKKPSRKAPDLTGIRVGLNWHF